MLSPWKTSDPRDIQISCNILIQKRTENASPARAAPPAGATAFGVVAASGVYSSGAYSIPPLDLWADTFHFLPHHLDSHTGGT